jgi:hypothetical protein
MIHAYILIETVEGKTEAVRASVGHGLGNCKAIGHVLRSPEVIAVIDCSDLNPSGDLDRLNQAITDIARLEGVKKVTTLAVSRD